MSIRGTSLSLLERLRNSSDDEAWRRFHDLYGPLIRYWLVQRGINQADADDIQQEVMQLAVVELAEFQHSGRVGALRCWLRQVVANRLRDYWRKRNREATAPQASVFATLAEQLADPNSELSKAWDEEYHRALCERLLNLAQNEFEDQTMTAFRRVTLGGLKPADAAEELGMTANAVRIAQSRVLRRLRELGQGMLD